MRSLDVKNTEVNTEKDLKTRRFRELGVLFRLSDFLLGFKPVQHSGVSQKRNGTLMNK